MNNGKSILYILLTGLGLILLYNYLIAPLLIRNNTEMGMGMHSRMYANTNYFIDVRYILFIAVVIAGFLLFELLKPQARIEKCCNCGKEIESDRWKVCPICGNSIESKKG